MGEFGELIEESPYVLEGLIDDISTEKSADVRLQVNKTKMALLLPYPSVSLKCARTIKSSFLFFFNGKKESYVGVEVYNLSKYALYIAHSYGLFIL